MAEQIKWEDLVYCSKGKILLNPEGQIQVSAYKADPVLFIFDLLKAAEEAQRRNNALLPITEYSSTFNQSTVPEGYYDPELKQNLDIVQISIQVATKEDQQIIRKI